MNTPNEQHDVDQTPAETGTDDFDLAFGQATGDATQPTEPVATAEPETETEETPEADASKPVEATASTEAAPDATKPAEQTAPAVDATKPAEQTAPAEPAKPTEAVPAVNLDAAGMAEAIAQALAERDSKNTPAAQPEEEIRVHAPADFLNPTTVAAIEKFKAEWPDEFKAVESLTQAVANAACYNTYNQLTRDFNKVLAPILARLQESEVNTQQTLVHAAHSDYDTLLPAVKSWVATMPAFLRPAMEQVLKSGTAQERIDLLNHYKGATVQTGAAPATPASSAVQETPSAPAAKPVNPAAAKALAAVPVSQRSKPVTSADPADFDSAFQEAIGS